LLEWSEIGNSCFPHPAGNATLVFGAAEVDALIDLVRRVMNRACYGTR
jgi:hypothetical protein